MFAKLSTNRVAASEASLRPKTWPPEEGRDGEQREQDEGRTQGVILFLFAAFGFKCGQVVLHRESERERETRE